MTKDEALRLALKALENSWTEPNNEQYVIEKEAITALRLVIDMENMASESTYKEQLETKDDPVAWEQFHEHMAGPNYVAPQRTWVGLTDEDLKPICDEWRIVYGAWMHDFARDIEAKLKEKNT